MIATGGLFNILDDLGCRDFIVSEEEKNPLL